MKLSTAIQESLVALLCFDDSAKGAKLVKSLVPASHFDPYYREIAREAEIYLERYDRPPGEHTIDIIEQLKVAKPDRSDIYDRLFESMAETKDVVNNEYIISRATEFSRFQSLRSGISQALDALEREDAQGLDDAEKLLDAAKSNVDTTFDGGLSLAESRDVVSFLDDYEPAFPTGIPHLDKYDLGPARKTLHVFVAPPTAGKSWWMVNVGKRALLQRKKVLHVTLEMSARKTMSRYVQAFFSIAKRDSGQLERQVFGTDESGRFIEFRGEDIPKRPDLQQENIRNHILKRWENMPGKRNLRIKEFPSGSLTINGLNNFLDMLEGAGNFIPDIILLDYADEMAIDPGNYRLSLGAIYRDLRGLAVERNMAVATASQCNRQGGASKWVTREHISEDYSKIARADTILMYSQTEEEFKLGLSRLLVDKSRDDMGRHSRLILSQAYDIGQFVMDSALFANDDYFSDVELTDE